MMTKGKHAKVRQQQRCVPEFMIGILRKFGKTTYSKGRRILHLHNKRARHNAQGFMTSIGMLPDNHLLDAYAVVGEGEEIITAGWRRKRILRDWNSHSRGGKRKSRR
ncbi:MAG: hypothetical protein ACR2P4_04175 [Gammaproteobacteria bacterium]